MTGYQIKSGIAAVKCFRKYAGNSKAPVMWGGAHATAMPLETLKSKYVDYICVGQAKDNFIDFLNMLKNGKADSSCPVDIFSIKNFPKTNKRYEVIDYKYDLSDFPSFCFEDFDFSYLLTNNKVLNYTASIGCPGACTFCSWGGRHPWNALPLKRVLDDIEYLVKRYKLKSLWFSDSELSINKDYFLGLAQGFIDRKLNIYWRCNARVMELSRYEEKDFSLLAASGLDRLFLGIENVNIDIQKLYCKIIPPKIVFGILEKSKKFDIQMMMSFIFGNPRFSNDLKENRDFLTACQKINPNVRFQVCFYTPYPGTYMTDLVAEDGYREPRNLIEYGTSQYFLDIDRAIKNRITWYGAKESRDYTRLYLKLFPKVDSAAEWNWREQKKHAK